MSIKNFKNPWVDNWAQGEIFHPDWLGEAERNKIFFNPIENNKNSLKKKNVKSYTNFDIPILEKQLKKAIDDHQRISKEYRDYYISINKLDNSSSASQFEAVLSDANKIELNRLLELQSKNLNLLKEAKNNQKQWNKLDREIENVVYDFCLINNLDNSNALDPNLLKALMFTETEMGAGLKYLAEIKRVEEEEPANKYQLNLGRVTDPYVYRSVRGKYNIPIDKNKNYLEMGNKYDVMLAAGALIEKMFYAKNVKNNDYFKKDNLWYNAVVAFKSATEKGAKNAKNVFKLYETGIHPHTDSKKLFNNEN